MDIAASPLSPTPESSTDKEDPPSRPPLTPSPDRVKCAICLGDLVNKSYSNACIHQFCFGCLLEWSKVKPECPLCKSTFRCIYHNIRSNSDFDEYVVPTPIPSLSIRVSSGTDRSPELLITRGNHDYTLPNYNPYHALSDPRIYRFQLAPFGTSRNDAIDVLLHGRGHGHGHGHGHMHHPYHHHSALTPSTAAYHENPFHDDIPEFFGGILDLASRAPYQHSTRFSGYQSRRRRYDRNQWVRPFDSTLVPGTVFFPSVEYFQRHPDAMRRVSHWLHRELTVLMSLSNSRTQMAFTYDLVVSLLLRYDIRSNDFRDLVRPYLGSKTKHFQHEFYHYVLSGMRMEEFDNIAQYASTSGQGPSFARPGENPYNSQPAIVTLGDSDDDTTTPEIVIEDDGDNSVPVPNPLSTRTSRGHGGSGRSRESRIRHTGPSSRSAATANIDFSPIDLSNESIEQPFASRADIDNAFSEIDNEIERLRNTHHSRHSRTSPRISSRDPEMPVLEPQVDLNNLSSNSNSGYSGSGSGSSSAFRRIREQLESSSATPPQLLDFINLNDSELNNLFEDRADRRFVDPEDGRSPPYPRMSSDPALTQLLGFTAPRENRPLASPDFPVLQFQETRERRHRQQQNDSNITHGTITPWPTPVALERPSCIHSSSSSNANNPSVQISIYPNSTPTMDFLSPLGLNLSSRGDSRSGGVIRGRPRTPGRPPSPNTQPDEGECEFLGVHPIVKKPPLAVITLSSEDETDIEVAENTKKDNHLPTKTQTEALISDEPIPGTSAELMAYYSLPPKRRYVAAPPPGQDTFLAALSSLPPADLMERHMDSIPPFRISSSSKRTSKSSSRDHSAPVSDVRTRSKKLTDVNVDDSNTTWERPSTRHESRSTTRSSSSGKKRSTKTRAASIKPWHLLLSNAPPSFHDSFNSDIDLKCGSDSDEDFISSSKKLKKKSKKSKKSSKSKSKLPKDKSKKESKSKRKQVSSTKLKSEQNNNSSTGSSSTSSLPLKSVVVNMTLNKPKGSKYTSKPFISSSSESSGEESTPRIRSVIASIRSNGSLTTPSSSSVTLVGGTGSSQSQDIQTPASALDLTTSTLTSSPFMIERMTMSSSIRQKKLSRRWESDDDEDETISGKPGSECGSLLSVEGGGGYNDNDEIIPDSDNTDNSDSHSSKEYKRLRRIDDDDDDF